MNQLQTIWIDPTFEANQSAFYYFQVLELPTSRWTTYDAKTLDVNLPSDVPTVL